MAGGNGTKGLGQPGVRIDAVEFAGLDQRGDDGPVLGTGIVTCEERVLPVERNRPFILPISVRSEKFTIVGIPIFGRKVIVRLVEQRAAGQFLKVEGHSGIVVSIPGWMVDPLACADMKIDQPQVDLTTLSDLKRLVTPTAARKHSPSENGVVREEVDEAAQCAYADLWQANEPDVRPPQGGRDARRVRR